MKPNEILTNPGAGASANPEFLNAMETVHVEEQTPLEVAEELLETRRLQLVLRMTSLRFKELSAVEKRNYARWAKHFRNVFGEKASLFERNSRPEPETPEVWRERGVG